MQIAKLTARITQMTKHLQEHRKDYAATRGLNAMLSSRRHFLQYVYKHNRSAPDCPKGCPTLGATSTGGSIADNHLIVVNPFHSWVTLLEGAPKWKSTTRKSDHRLYTVVCMSMRTYNDREHVLCLAGANTTSYLKRYRSGHLRSRLAVVSWLRSQRRVPLWRLRVFRSQVRIYHLWQRETTGQCITTALAEEKSVRQGVQSP